MSVRTYLNNSWRFLNRRDRKTRKTGINIKRPKRIEHQETFFKGKICPYGHIWVIASGLKTAGTE